MIDYIAFGCIATGTGTWIDTLFSYASHVRGALRANGALGPTVGWHTYVFR